MSKRISVTLPDVIGEQLEYWADQEGRPVANLCNFILEKAVREAEQSGSLPPRLPTTPRTTDSSGQSPPEQ